jgi:hypothetical protein
LDPLSGKSGAPHADMDDDWPPEEPATIAAYELLQEWVRWNGEQADVPGPLIERSAAVAESRQFDTSDCPSFHFRPRGEPRQDKPDRTLSILRERRTRKAP